MAKEVKFSLVFRDMWQSAGKYQPRVDQLVKVAPKIIEMGCWDRVETNGGGFEQVNLLYGENPNRSVREWTSKDLRKLFYVVKKKQGTDITRIFCGLNDPRNVIPSIGYAKEAGMIAQAALCITHSPIHTVEYYVNLAKQFIDAGADEICLKDMAGIGRPESLGKIVAGIKAYKKDIVIQYHSHAGPGFNIASILEVCKAGCDYIDCGMSPLSWGTGHADVITVQEMLKDAGFKVKDINMKAYMEVRTQIQEMMDDFLGYYIPELNHLNNSLLVKPGLPGGMMGSLMTDLEENLEGLNRWKEKNGQPKLSTDDLLIKLFDEVAYVWPRVGYPCLVTPFSQYVKNLALMNVMQMEKGKERWSLIADNIWDMILGKSGKLPGPVAPELVELAKSQGRKFETEDPQTYAPDCLDEFRAKMKANGWELGQDDEELFEYAMHPSQYEAYKSGKAKADFLEDLAKRKAAKNATTGEIKAQELKVTVNGEVYTVSIAPNDGSAPAASAAAAPVAAGEGADVLAPLEGKFFLVKNASEVPVKVGDMVKKGQTIGYIEAMKTYNAVAADCDGQIAAILANPGDKVFEDDPIFKIK